MPPTPLWFACLSGCGSSAAEAGPWLARYGPQPAPLGGGWVIELSASARLFGGRMALLQRLRTEAAARDWPRIGVAPTALAALALARDTPPDGGWRCALGADWSARLDALPIERLDATEPHREALAAAGLRTLGALRRCPRAALARRTAPALLTALDALYGHAPQPLSPWTATPVFEDTVTLPAPTTDAAALGFTAQRLLARLCHWLRQRQWGVLRWRLGWQGQPPEAALHFQHRRPLQDLGLLRALVQEALARTRLDDAVEGVWLQTLQTAPWVLHTPGLLPGQPGADALPWDALLERLSARLGAERVQQVTLIPHGDPVQRQRWQPVRSGNAATDARPKPQTASAAHRHVVRASHWEPPWWLPQPHRLSEDAAGRPRLDGQPLRRLLGPQRVATDWWDTPVERLVCVATTPDGRCWWLQRTRVSADGTWGPWEVAGVYA